MISLCLVLQSADVTLDWLRHVAAGVLLQLSRDVCPAWDVATIAMAVVDRPDAAPASAWQIVILPDSDLAGAAGYHSETPQGEPYGKVFTRDKGARVVLDELSVSISHECIEAVCNPSVNRWATGPDGIDRALEPADPVEGDSYTIDQLAPPVRVSNFVLPAWFDPLPPSNAQFDFLGLVGGPGVVRYETGGYIPTRKGGVRGTDPPTAAQRKDKQHPASRTARLLRGEA